MNATITFWAVHVYEIGKAGQPGKYLRTIDATLTESSGQAFCKVFNACGGLGCVAIAREHQAKLQVEGSCCVAQYVP